MAYPILYKANETNFEHLGVSVLSDASKCYVSREKNGIYILEFDYPVNGKDVDKIKEGMLIKSDAGYRTKNQRFIVSKITKTQNEFKIYCQHISQVKTTMNAIRPDITVTGSAMMALSTWRDNLLDSRDEFFVNSDITTVNSTIWKVENIENARDALGGKAGSILDVWGGEYEFDNLNITLHKNMGIDNPTIIAYGKNLLDLEQEQSILETYTSVFPFKKYTDDNNREQLITLPEILLDSTHLNKFAHRRILKVDFSNDENIKTVEQLRSKAESYIRSNNVGVPKTNLKINYQDLSKVEGIFDNPALEQIDLCDRLKVYYSELGILNENAKVVKVIWDVILEENHEIEVGDGRSSFTDSTSAKLESLQAQNDSVISRINTLIAEQESAYDRFFKEKSKVIEDKVKDGYEKALLSSEEKIRKMGEAFDEKLAPIRNQVSTTVENYNRQFQATNLEISKNRVEATKQIQALSDRVNNMQDISSNSTVVELRGLVNGATSKVTELENSITREFTNVKKKNEDSLSAVKAEFTKGVDGLASKITSLEEYKNQDSTRTENLKQWVQQDTASQLSRERTEIIRNVRDSIPTSVGGRNYIPNSGEPLRKEGHSWGGDWEVRTHPYYYNSNKKIMCLPNSTTRENFIRSPRFKLKRNTDYVISFKGFASRNTINMDVYVLGRRNNENNDFTIPTLVVESRKLSPSVLETVKNIKFNSGEMDEAYLRFDNNGSNDNQQAILFIAEVKLEEGVISTDWTPAPEDNNDFVKNTEFSSKFTESARGITNQLSALETYKNQDAVRVANLQIWAQNNTANQLTAARRSIESWVNEKGYATTSAIENKVQETANSFSREISNVRNSIPTSLGGRNYITNSKDLNSKNFYSWNKWEKSISGNELVLTKIGGSDTYGFFFNLTDLVKTQFQNETLTWSIDLKASRNVTLRNVGFETNGLKQVTITTEWQRISHTFINKFTNVFAFVFYNPTANFNNGDKIYIRLPKLEKGNIATDWTPAPEDVEQNVNELNTWKQTTTETLNTVSSNLNDTVKHSQLRVGADKIDFGSNKVFDGRNLASMLSVSPESIQAITDKLVITPANENLVLPEFRETVISNSRDKWITPLITGDKLQNGDQFIIEGVGSWYGRLTQSLNFTIEIQYKTGSYTWKFPVIVGSNEYSTSDTLKCTLTVTGLTGEVRSYKLGLLQNGPSNFTNITFKNAKIYKKKSAELIVDGSIEGRQIKTNTLETGHHKAESITSEIIAANAVKAKHVLIDDGLIHNLITHNAFINKLWAQQAFINKLNAVKIKSTQIDTDTLNGVVISGQSKIKIGQYGFLQPITKGLQINAPENFGSKRGIGLQIAGEGVGPKESGVPPGLFIYEDPDFTQGNTVPSAVNRVLLTVAGMACFSSRILGSVVKGQPILTNLDYSSPFSNHAPVKFIGYKEGGLMRFFSTDNSNSDIWNIKVDQWGSDRKLKTDIKDSEFNAIEFVDKLKFKEHGWNKDEVGYERPYTKCGLIAQELQALDESLVVDYETYLGLDALRLINIALKAVQELSQQNKELKNKLEEITNG
nr:MAG TPA: tail protein [Caudoviricetes sp.]